MDFIFMLTRDDQTVRDCLNVLDTATDLGLTHIGFKDIGVDRDTLTELHRRIKATGATSYLEVVSTDRENALASVRTAIDLGVDWLMGGTWVSETLSLLAGHDIGYLPFAGIPRGHPTTLAGTADQIADDCRRYEQAGCAGIDLLAYRAVDAEPLHLVRAARAATTGRLVVAGSIDSPEQIHALKKAGADAFTLGSAAFNSTFDPKTDTMRGQLDSILTTVLDMR